jgi:hypothetical protein
MEDLAGLKPGTHRNGANGEHLRRQEAVNAGRVAEKGNQKGKRSRRGASSPGT